MDLSVDRVVASYLEESAHWWGCGRGLGQRNEQVSHNTGYAYLSGAELVLWEVLWEGEGVVVRVVDAATLEGILVSVVVCVAVGLLGETLSVLLPIMEAFRNTLTLFL